MNTANKQYGRLTKKGGYTKELDLKQELGYSYIYNRLAELEDKIDNGTLVELPCKVGDTVYWVMDMDIFTYKVKGFSYNCNDDMGLRLILQEIEPSVSFYLGKRLFFTKAEAEARLKEIQEKQNETV